MKSNSQKKPGSSLLLINAAAKAAGRSSSNAPNGNRQTIGGILALVIRMFRWRGESPKHVTLPGDPTSTDEGRSFPERRVSRPRTATKVTRTASNARPKRVRTARGAAPAARGARRRSRIIGCRLRAIVVQPSTGGTRHG